MVDSSHPPGDKSQDGFTLIEILVVMVIIGILAAIAIPSFLAQRDKGYQAAEKSDLQNASLAEHAYATDYGGFYTGDVISQSASSGPLSLQGARTTSGVVVTATTFQSSGGVANDSFCLQATYVGKTSAVYWLTSATDTPTTTKPAGC